MTPGPVFFATVVVCVGDEATLDLLCDRLASDRFEPLPAASSAEAALRLCRGRRPDVQAAQAGIDTSTVEAILAGGHPVRLDELRRLAAALGVPAGALLIDGGEGKGGDDA